jgi:hypothetical protein
MKLSMGPSAESVGDICRLVTHDVGGLIYFWLLSHVFHRDEDIVQVENNMLRIGSGGVGAAIGSRGRGRDGSARSRCCEETVRTFHGLLIAKNSPVTFVASSPVAGHPLYLSSSCFACREGGQWEASEHVDSLWSS